VRYYGYRYYDPVTGRWISRDPIGDMFSDMPYLLCGNETIGDYDILGLMPIRVWIDLKWQPKSAQVYFQNWIDQHPGLTDEQIGAIYDVFKRGCIGITEIELGLKINPPLSNCYGNMAQALDKQRAMIKNCDCAKFKNAYGKDSQPRIFAFQFFTGSPDNWKPDESRGGKVDFEDGFIDTRRAPSAFSTPFNFCLYDPAIELFTYATMSGYFDVLRSKEIPSDFDVTVYCVACEDWQYGAYAQVPKVIEKPTIPIGPRGGKKSW
jgi:hypothetical protein